MPVEDAQTGLDVPKKGRYRVWVRTRNWEGGRAASYGSTRDTAGKRDAALTASRLGCKVALVQNRPALGGNNSA